jgi:hypothetical protein
LPGNHTDTVTMAHRRGTRGRRTSLSMYHFMLQTRSVDETSADIFTFVIQTVENRRRIDDRYCVPSGFSLPLSFKVFHSVGITDSGPLVPGFVTPGELKPFLHVVLQQPTIFPLISSHFPVGKFLELPEYITRLWKSKLTPWFLPSPLVHVLLSGPCGGKVRPLWPLHVVYYESLKRALHCGICFFFLSRRYGRA